MEAYINIALIFIVIVAFSVFVANKVKKNRESMEEKDINVDDKTYTLDMMIQFIKTEFIRDLESLMMVRNWYMDLI